MGKFIAPRYSVSCFNRGICIQVRPPEEAIEERFLAKCDHNPGNSLCNLLFPLAGRWRGGGVSLSIQLSDDNFCPINGPSLWVPDTRYQKHLPFCDHTFFDLGIISNHGRNFSRGCLHFSSYLASSVVVSSLLCNLESFDYRFSVHAKEVYVRSPHHWQRD